MPGVFSSAIAVLCLDFLPFWSIVSCGFATSTRMKGGSRRDRAQRSLSNALDVQSAARGISRVRRSVRRPLWPSGAVATPQESPRPLSVRFGCCQTEDTRGGKTQTAKSAIVAPMADAEAIRRERKLLAAELKRYFGETCPALATRWEAGIIGLAPPVLRELAGRLQALETVIDETNAGAQGRSGRNHRGRGVG